MADGEFGGHRAQTAARGETALGAGAGRLVERGPATRLARLAEAGLAMLAPSAQGAVDRHAGHAEGRGDFELGGLAEVGDLGHAAQSGGFVVGGMAVNDVQVAHIGGPAVGLEHAPDQADGSGFRGLQREGSGVPGGGG